MDMLLTKPSGIQKGPTEVIPRFFDFRREVLDGGALDPRILRAVVDLTISKTFPMEKGVPGLINWDDFYPNQLMTYASAYNQLNKSMNHKAISKGRAILPVSDDEISELVSLTGMLSPKDIESGFSPYKGGLYGNEQQHKPSI
jgi:hypothetical protein